MERSGVPITEAAYRHGVSTGISYGARFPGLVPPFEEYEAMVSANYSEGTWQAASWRAKARAVAAYRLRQWVDLHRHDAAQPRPRAGAGKG